MEQGTLRETKCRYSMMRLWKCGKLANRASFHTFPQPDSDDYCCILFASQILCVLEESQRAPVKPVQLFG